MGSDEKNCDCKVEFDLDRYIYYCPLHARAPAMAEMLKELEWAWVHEGDIRCRICRAYQTDGHMDDCRLQVLLKQIGED